MRSQLPQGWVRVGLEDIAKANMGETILAKDLSDIGYPVYSAGQENKPWGFLNNPKKILSKGTVIISARGSIGFPKIPKEAQFTSTQTTISLKFTDVTLAEYSRLWLKTLDWSELTKGGTIPMLTVRAINKLTIPLAPSSEQERIVRKLKRISSKLDLCQKHLEKIPVLLKRFRQSVLSAACSGRLTADWRPGNRTEPIKTLISKLKTQEPEKHRDVFERSSTNEIPASWAWVRLGKLGSLLGGGTPSKNNPAYWNGKIPWVSPKDMKRNRINDSEDHITAKALENSTTKLIPKGSILFVVRGMILNHTLPTAITDVEVTLNQDMKALVPEIQDMSEYLFLVSNHISKAILFEVKEATHGTRRIETLLLKNWAIPVPPINEQKEIVKRVQTLFTAADKIETRYKKAKAQVDRLSQSVLAKAFRGELVTQETSNVPVLKTKPTTEKVPVTADGPGLVYFQHISPRREDRYVNCVPSLDLEIAAGAFGDDQRPDFNEWVEINTARPLKKGMFVAKVTGRSMEPLIPDGAYCLFQFKAPQLRNDMVAVFQLHDSEDPESGGHYTVKRLKFSRRNTADGITRIATLLPENPAFQPISVNQDNVKFIAEFLEVLQPLANKITGRRILTDG